MSEAVVSDHSLLFYQAVSRKRPALVTTIFLNFSEWSLTRASTVSMPKKKKKKRKNSIESIDQL